MNAHTATANFPAELPNSTPLRPVAGERTPVRTADVRVAEPQPLPQYPHAVAMGARPEAISHSQRNPVQEPRSVPTSSEIRQWPGLDAIPQASDGEPASADFEALRNPGEVASAVYPQVTPQRATSDPGRTATGAGLPVIRPRK